MAAAIQMVAAGVNKKERLAYNQSLFFKTNVL